MSGDLPEVLLATRRGINTGAGEACMIGASVAITVTAGILVIDGKITSVGVFVKDSSGELVINGVDDKVAIGVSRG
jgi:hypothetical protein